MPVGPARPPAAAWRRQPCALGAPRHNAAVIGAPPRRPRRRRQRQARSLRPARPRPLSPEPPGFSDGGLRRGVFGAVCWQGPGAFGSCRVAPAGASARRAACQRASLSGQRPKMDGHRNSLKAARRIGPDLNAGGHLDKIEFSRIRAHR